MSGSAWPPASRSDLSSSSAARSSGRSRLGFRLLPLLLCLHLLAEVLVPRAHATEHTLSLSRASGESSDLDEGGDPVELVIDGSPSMGDYELFIALNLRGMEPHARDYTVEYEVNPGDWHSITPVSHPRFSINALPAKLRVTAEDDGVAEGSESITVTLVETPHRFQFGYACPITPENPSLGCIDEFGTDQSTPPPHTYRVGTPSSVSLTINDNDDPPRTTPVASFASAASSAGEGAGTRNVTVNLSPAPQSAIALSYTVGGTATAGEDFTIANSGSVEVSANATSATIPVAIVDDADDESAETVVLTLGAGAGYTVGTGNVHTLAIQDNDDPPFNTPVVS
ncbi:MAG: hypothetical protein OXI12_10310, partial [Gammaproteobacteria bacterium]|nr:hypothetical protein [Gammaproteobacteria bacterium]